MQDEDVPDRNCQTLPKVTNAHYSSGNRESFRDSPRRALSDGMLLSYPTVTCLTLFIFNSFFFDHGVHPQANSHASLPQYYKMQPPIQVSSVIIPPPLVSSLLNHPLNY